MASGEGRAEIAFEDGSTVFLAPNSLLLFTELSAHHGHTVTVVTLATGTATFSVELVNGGYFYIATPTDTVQVVRPDVLFARVDAYLDATAITFQENDSGKANRAHVPVSTLTASGHTIYLNSGQVVSSRASGIPVLGEGLQPQTASSQETKPIDGNSENGVDTESADRACDDWVTSRRQEEKETMAAAVKASGAGAPFPGLAELYAEGTFFECAPYGTCWDPAPQEASSPSPAAAASMHTAQAPSANAQNSVFRPQVVEIKEIIRGVCGTYRVRTVSYVAHTLEELQQLLLLKEKLELPQLRSLRSDWGPQRCLSQSWIPRHHHYAMVISHLRPCPSAANCKPGRPPRPVFLRKDGKIGLVPRHPDDVAGKPPLNLKSGIVMAGEKPGDPPTLVAWNPSDKVEFVDKAPKEFARELAPPPPQAVAAHAPAIRAQLLQDAFRGDSKAAENRGASQILYDYKTRQFTMPASAASVAKGRGVAMASISSHGTVASHSGRGGSGSRGSGSGSSGGSSGHSSGGSSGGGSHSSGSSGSSSSSSAGGAHGH